MKTSDAMAEILKREGVKYLFGYPRNALLDAAAKKDIRTIIVRQERTGLHMADAVSRITRGKIIGAFCMQHGPGAENAYGGVAQAYADSIPILVVPQGYARKNMYLPYNYNSTLQMRGISKHNEPILIGAETPHVMRRAFTQLRNGRPQPVVVEVPFDAFLDEVPEPLDYTPVYASKSAADPEQVVKAAKIIADAKKLVIHAGQGVHWADAYKELQELAELLGAPVSTSLPGKSTFNERHPLSLGSGGHGISGQLWKFVNDADVIFGIGCSFTESSFAIQFPQGPGKRYVHSTNDPVDLNKTIRSEIGLVGDAKLVLKALIAELRKTISSNRDASKVAAEIKAVEADWIKLWLPKINSNSSPLSPYRVLTDLQKTVDIDNTIITHDAGSPRDQLVPFWKSTTPLSYIGWGKTTQLGYGLPLAMGAKLVHPEKLCINVWGDAAIGFTGMDFETAVRDRLPILSILLNNFTMAIELPIMPAATEKYRATDISGDYAAMARAFGGYGERVTKADDIVAAIKRGIEATQKGQPALLEFITEQETEVSRPWIPGGK
ncbi:MAG TPA: thiamine pyrophosphate-requiring protein [Steroidobacteraceae bacterium]|nr:thiamine pyrophosphate-requiring protein [Steroidobacteraceae bacterium]